MQNQAEARFRTQGEMWIQRAAALLAVLLFAVAAWKLAGVLIAVFAAILLAIGLNGCASYLARRTGIRTNVALAAILFIGVILSAVIAWLFGAIISDQFDELGRTLPKSTAAVAEHLRSHAYGRFIIEHLRDINVADTTSRLATILAGIAGIIINGLLYGVLVVTVAVYFAAQPKLYLNGVFSLIPPASRDIASRLFERLASLLRRWLLGQFIVMLIVGAASGSILWMLGIDAAIALGVISGLLTFIPYIGAVLAAVPATLIGFGQSPIDAGLVVLMYLGIHYFEGDFITPWIQAKATALPPALSVLSTVAFGALLGPAGVLVAAPLTLVLITAVDILYVEHNASGKAA